MWSVDLETDGRDILICGLGDRWKRYLGGTKLEKVKFWTGQQAV